MDPEICSTRPKQPKFSIHNIEKENSETDPVQQKERKQRYFNQ